jgi:cytochrome bd-type quinol oxidase subunit 1
MDVVLLARLQFALTIAFHYIFPPLTIMLIIALVGMPFVLAYTGIIYWTFRGKVRLDEHSY